MIGIIFLKFPSDKSLLYHCTAHGTRRDLSLSFEEKRIERKVIMHRRRRRRRHRCHRRCRRRHRCRHRCRRRRK